MNDTIETSREIIQTQPQQIAEPIKSFDPEREIDNAQKAATALMKVIKATKPLEMGGKQYLYFEHWQTIARFYGYTVGIEWAKPITDDNGEIEGYEARAVLYNRNGLIVGAAEASCMRDEPNWSNKPDFQLRSMAQTRAQAKVLRSNLGYIAVLAGVEATPAEEMADGERVGSIRKGSWGSQPSPKQLELIEKLMTQKGITEEDLINAGFKPSELTGGKEGTASELIDYLLKAKSKVINGQALPVIDQEAAMYM